METQRGLLWRPTPLTGWGVSIAAPKGMRRAPRRVRLRVILNGGFAPKPPGKKLLTRGLGGKAPIRNPVRGPRDVERTYGQFAVSERAANASLFAARRVQGNMRNGGVKKIGASYFEWPDF